MHSVETYCWLFVLLRTTFFYCTALYWNTCFAGEHAALLVQSMSGDISGQEDKHLQPHKYALQCPRISETYKTHNSQDSSSLNTYMWNVQNTAFSKYRFLFRSLVLYFAFLASKSDFELVTSVVEQSFLRERCKDAKWKKGDISTDK